MKVCTATFTKMWTDGTPTREIAEALHISADYADSTRRSLKLPPRKGWTNAKQGGRAIYLPSLEEIAEKCEGFRAGWSDEERARRRVGPSTSSAIRVIPEGDISSPEDDEQNNFG